MSKKLWRRDSLWRKDSLWLRDLDRQSAATWRDVLEHLKDHRAPSAAKAARNIKKLIKRRRTPSLVHNGGKS